MVTSGLLHCRSQKINKLASQIGYHLFATKTPKRTIEMLHRQGLSIVYETIVKNLKKFAKESEADLRKWAESFPVFFVSFDNLNFLAAIRDARLLNRSQLINYTAGYIAFNPWSRSQTMFKQSAIDSSNLRNVNSNMY